MSVFIQKVWSKEIEHFSFIIVKDTAELNYFMSRATSVAYVWWRGRSQEILSVQTAHGTFTEQTWVNLVIGGEDLLLGDHSQPYQTLKSTRKHGGNVTWPPVTEKEIMWPKVSGYNWREERNHKDKEVICIIQSHVLDSMSAHRKHTNLRWQNIIV